MHRSLFSVAVAKWVGLAAWLMPWFGEGLAGKAAADFVFPSLANGFLWDRPTTAGGPATFQAWESFSSTAGPNAPDPSVQGAGTGDPSVISTGAANVGRGFGGDASAVWSSLPSGGTPNAFDRNAATNGGFLTSGGNIYSPGGVLAPRLLIPNNIDGLVGNHPFGATSIIVQLRTQGSVPDLASFRLTDPVSGMQVGPISSAILASMPAGGFGGTLQDLRVDFQVNGNADLYTIDFVASSSSMSLDRIAVDTFHHATAIPEPSSLGMVTLALAGAAGFRRRRS